MSETAKEFTLPELIELTDLSWIMSQAVHAE